MYVANVHTTSQQLTVDEHFVCSSCGFQSPVRITTVGAGQGVAHYGVGNTAAHAAAHAHAIRSAQKSATMVREVLTCPRCRVKSKEGGRTRFFWIVLPLAVLGVSLGLVIVSVSLLTFVGTKLGGLGGALVFTATAPLALLIPSTLFILMRTRPTIRLRRDADKHAEFPPPGAAPGPTTRGASAS